jgi:plastocyanin
MKQGKTILAGFILFMLIFTLTARSTIRVVQASDFTFTPNSMNVFVGDTIKWQWINGIHTTTSVSVPQGAASWDEPLTLTSQTFFYVVTAAGSYNYVCTPHSPGMSGSFSATPIGIVPIGGSVPSKFNLSQNFPNPFNPVTNIKIDIPASSQVNLTVYDLLGNVVEVLYSGNLNAGSYAVDWNASNYSSGIYFYTLRTGNFTDTKRMVLVK